MTPRQKNDALTILLTCKNLEVADEKLKKYFPLPNQRAMRWALFDGFQGRIKSTAGLCGKEPDPEIIKDYNEFYEVGIELSMRGLPA